MSTSTRESMRLELKELAKLAETMRKESEARASADLLQAYESEPVQQPEEPTLSASSVTVPPVVPPSTPPPDESAEVRLPGLGTGRGRFLTAVVGAGLAAALVGGAVLARSLASQRATASRPAPVVAAAAAVVPLPAQPADPPVPPAAAAPAIESPVVVAAPAAPPAIAPPAPRRRTPGLRHFTKPGSAKVAVATSTPDTPAAAGAAETETSPPAAPAPKPAVAKPAGGPNAAPPTTSGDSLEDMIRKAVAAPAKK
jgi:hypothetical protein